MPELRRDALTGRWVAIAPDRAARPMPLLAGTGAGAPSSELDPSCPFCPGQEQTTPSETYALRAPGTEPNTPGWSVRVVANKYPAVIPEAVGPAFGDPLLEVRAGRGLHEVIVESPRHATSPAQLSAEQWRDVVATYAARIAALRASGDWQYVYLFKNSGAEAGASLAHVHSQLLALPWVPPEIAARVAAARQRFEERGTCLWCDLAARELAASERIVLTTERWVAFCPYASRFPYETWLLPRSHAAHFADLTLAELADLADCWRELLRRLESVLPAPHYNCLLHTSPFDTTLAHYYHWHIELAPRINRLAGFELGTGVYINTVYPEEAARRLRGA